MVGGEEERGERQSEYMYVHTWWGERKKGEKDRVSICTYMVGGEDERGERQSEYMYIQGGGEKGRGER